MVKTGKLTIFNPPSKKKKLTKSVFRDRMKSMGNPFGTSFQKSGWDNIILVHDFKIICADRGPVGLYYNVDLKWHMPTWGENMPFWTKIYANFWDHERARFPEKSKAQKRLANWCNAWLRIFLENAFDEGPGFLDGFGFFLGFADSKFLANQKARDGH